MVELTYLLIAWMWDVRENGVKNDSKVFGLGNYKKGVVIRLVLPKTTEESKWFFCLLVFILFC